ncbi:N-acetylmuramoyl-L-alanine amidase [Idiomarina xiamenensis]|uniref:N-acetylmuramoyl-L-alanine amidase AmiC n=1 Tax=Idiomarina xiamenensis 10-D-4 TaxID=740709 RepID=K2KVA3_9GAMM|nr:N-acetylmuramoyl-L-alanine amidase [Idiomarina xiamenensis]EKE81545.1 N-acetylmuramoyl-L-alanine amidase [Idiomarina xiamenensis 10-D-4]
MKRWLLLILLCLPTVQAVAANDIQSVRVWPSPDKTRIVFDLSAKPDYSYFTLYDSQPYRLVIDFRDTERKASLTNLGEESLLVKKVRTSSPQYANSTRIVIELNSKSQPEVFSLPANETYSDRLVVDLPGESVRRTGPAKSVDELKERVVTVAIDAGHGGDDPGSIGPSGTYEKHVVLKIAQALATQINNDPGMQAYLVRTGDYYLTPDSRPEKAREAKADLFISIHADAFTSPGPNGASVWVLSKRRANSEIGRWLETREKHSELLGGAAEILQGNDSESYLARTLLDMSMDNSMAGGYNVANEIIDEMKRITRMHKSKPQAASFAVLKSPDIPSILVETGFISNPREEKNLLSRNHQNKLASAIYNGVRRYFVQNPIDGTYFAKHRSTRHIVKSGESLSILAQRYNTSISAIKSHNNLQSTVLKIGQVLEIPAS